MSETKETGRVVIASASDSFLAKSLMTKLEEAEVASCFSHTGIRELENCLEKAELIILFASEELEETPESIVYIKDSVIDREQGLILIGGEEQYGSIKKMIPEQFITQWQQRPVDIDRLVKSVCSYLDENSGEKRKKTVLIVDDDITYMRTVYEWLKGSYHVGMASNGVQAISYLAKNRADLILLDYEMPIANGPQVLSMLKSDSQTEEIPVMFLTGHGDRDSVLSVVGLSPVDYLLKTIDRNTLLKKLADFFAKTKQTGEKLQ